MIILFLVSNPVYLLICIITFLSYALIYVSSNGLLNNEKSPVRTAEEFNSLTPAKHAASFDPSKIDLQKLNEANLESEAYGHEEYVYVYPGANGVKTPPKPETLEHKESVQKTATPVLKSQGEVTVHEESPEDGWETLKYGQELPMEAESNEITPDEQDEIIQMAQRITVDHIYYQQMIAESNVVDDKIDQLLGEGFSIEDAIHNLTSYESKIYKLFKSFAN